MKLAQLVKQDIPILDDARSRGFTPKRIGPNEYILAEHDSMRIDAANNLCSVTQPVKAAASSTSS